MVAQLSKSLPFFSHFSLVVWVVPGLLDRMGSIMIEDIDDEVSQPISSQCDPLF